MINTRLKAHEPLPGGREIVLENRDGDIVARFSSAAFFYIVTGFKSAQAYNDHHEDEPTKFLVWKLEH